MYHVIFDFFYKECILHYKGIYMGPPQPQNVVNKPPLNPAGGGMYSAYGGGGGNQQRQMPSAAPYRDPEFAEAEYNRGLRNPTQQQQLATNNDPYNRVNSQYSNMTQHQHQYQQQQYQQMSSNPNVNRRMMWT